MAVSRAIKHIRRRALAASLATPTTLGRAIRALGFVQADPIRAPARAQDLILRHRVAGYRAGDLERAFKHLGLEEDYLYAYGFMPRATQRLLHPRHDPAGPEGRHAATGLAAEVLAFVREQGSCHPLDLEAAFGRERALNGWGGFSKATTRALQSLHYYGLLRVQHRREGIRVYEAAAPHPEPGEREDRMRRLVLLVARILAPAPAASFAAALRLLARGAPGLGDMAATTKALLKTGALESGEVDGETYLWPAGLRTGDGADAPRCVRFLAPFDPVVWDRRRFEHLWGWSYRFEAYTPPAKRRFGYYAMPLLWTDQVIGWVNLATSQGRLQLEAGFSTSRPKGRDFRHAFAAEVARVEAFLTGARGERTL